MLDERTLSRVAEITDGEYYLAESVDELLEVFSTIPVQLEKKKKRVEISAVLTAISALFALSLRSPPSDSGYDGAHCPESVR